MSKVEWRLGVEETPKKQNKTKQKKNNTFMYVLRVGTKAGLSLGGRGWAGSLVGEDSEAGGQLISEGCQGRQSSPKDDPS